MTNSLRYEFHIDMATTILNEIQYKRSNYYYFLGKIEPWGVDDTTAGPVQLDSDLENTLIRSNMIFMRKIMPNDVSIVTKRFNWEADTLYSIYDHTKKLENVNYYCVTEDNTVYKCLDNNGGVNSTIKPSGTSFYPFRTADGYLWKYMYTVPTFKRTRFMALEQLPVQRALSDSFYNKGSVDAVYVSSSGKDYTDVSLTTVAVTGTVSGAGASGDIAVDLTGGITSANVITGGTDYVAGVVVTVNSTTGSGAVISPVITAGVVTSLDVVSAGVGYDAEDTLVFSTGGAILVPAVSRITGTIEHIKIVNPGIGYTTTPTLVINSATAAGTGKYGNPTALASCILFEGSIVEVNIQDPGIEYPVDTATSIVVQGDGTGAVFSPVVDSGEVVDVVIENAGSGYTSMSLIVVGSGTGATLTPIISASDFISDQSIVEQTSVNGGIYSVVVEEGGTNYSASTTIEIVGDGTGCTATPTIVNGVITKITVDTYGQGYTYASFNVIDDLRSIYAGFVDASGYVVISPIGGHGSDAVAELNGNTLAINASLRQDSNLNKLVQDYRQFGMIKNPKNILSGKLAIEESSLILYETEFTNTDGLVLDEILIKDNMKFRVVHFDGSLVYLQPLNINNTDIVGTLVAETSLNRSYILNKILKYPVINKYTGNLLYVSNESPFSFSQEQGIIIKTFLKF